MKSHLFRISVCAWLAATRIAVGTTTVSVTDSIGDANAASVAPGGSLVVNITASADETILVIDGDLVAGTANILDLTALSYGDGWDQPGGDLAYPDPYAPPYGLDTSLHLASARPDFSTVTGSITFATITILIDASTVPGTYSLRFDTVEVADENFDTVDIADGPDYQITVTGAAPPGGGGDPVDPPVDPVDPGTGGDGGAGESEPSEPDGGGGETGGGNEPNEIPTEQPGAGTDSGNSDNPADNSEVTPTVSRPACGAGVTQAALVGLTGLFLLQGKTRRRRSR